MKFVTAYLILTALVFLNVPRSLVHHHDHETHHNDETESGFEDENCFVCEFQLDLALTPSPLSFKKASCHFAVWNAKHVEVLRSNAFSIFEHRGPPTI